MSSHTVHIFDAVARDQRVLRATEDTIEVEYVSGNESEDSEFIGRGGAKGKGSVDNRELVIHLFGSLSDGKPVRIEVNGFRPFFYIGLPANTTPSEESRLKTKLEDAVRTRFSKQSSQLQFKLVHKQKLFGYTGGKSYGFVQISVPSLGMFYEVRKFFLDDRQMPKWRPSASSAPLMVYESNIDPMLRFFHMRNLQPCGWISVRGVVSEGEDDSTLQLQADWEDIDPAVAPGPVVAPFKHAFWDVECYSHDGEFPVATQGYRRVAKQLWAKARQPEEVGSLLQEAFFPKAESVTEPQVQLPPLLHPKLWPKEKEIQSIVEAESFKREVGELWDGRDRLNGKEKEERVAGLTKLLDRVFKRVAPIAGDPIIQIGTVSWRNGQTAGERYIFVLGDCAEVAGATVVTAKTEKELLLKWFQWLEQENFDIFVGYNIFGFDEKYVWDRLVELGLEMEESVQKLTRLFDQGGEMKLSEKFLSSSALGDNTLYMWTTPGRLRIDLLGHVRRKTAMNSYKLDSVAAAFLSGKLSGVLKCEKPGQWLLKTKQKGDARIGRYVQVLDEMGEELTEKMPIVAITDTGLVVESEEELEAIANEAAKWAVVKDDVPPKEIFRLHRGSNEDRARVAAYCVQDCDLVLELYRKLDVFNEAMSMANVCSVPVGYIFTRGQGIKIESLIFKDCMTAGQLIEVLPGTYGSGPGGQGAGEDSYEGAIVLDPEPGFYTDAPVGVCDFASLYPSTIISENISHDMLVWVKDYDMKGELVCVKYGSEEAELLAPAGTRFTDIEFDIWRPDPADTRKHPVKVRAGVRVCRYAQPAGDVKGSLPTIVAKLLAARKAKRNEMAKTDDPFKKALLDAEQNAYKVTANSLYGQLGSATFKIRLQHLAASVTSYGRKQILFAKAAIEKFYGPEAKDPRCCAEGVKTVYGDSVTGDTPLYIKKTTSANPELCRIDELSSLGSWAEWHETKESIELNGELQIWTERGWTHVRRIIRHKLQPGKKMYRILTHTGVVDCTEDHSLVGEKGQVLKPSEVAVGTPLLHNYTVSSEFAKEVQKEIDTNEAWAMGFFLADGSADVYNCPSGMKATWAINKADTELLNIAKKKLPFETKIIDTLESSGVYKLIPVGEIKPHAIHYRNLFYNEHREKRIPSCILNASNEIIKEFLRGFYAGDGDKANGFGNQRWDQKGKEVSAGLWILSRRLGYNISFNDRADKESVFRMTLTDKTQHKNPIAIKRIRELPTENIEYVYDLETENHHFAVGPGALIVHNTDSLFVCFNPKNPETGERLKGREAIVATIELTEEAGKFVTGALKAPHDFEYDKVFYPFIIFSKKRYVGNKYEESPDEFKETSMGIVLKRRDNAPLLKMCYGGAIDRLLNHRDIPGAIQCVKEKVNDLVEGRMKLSQLTITKSLRAEYASAPPAHKMLADRMAARDPGNAPSSGDRIGYVYIKAPTGQAASKLQGDRVETPAYIVEKGLKPDAEYYIEHQLYNPLAQLFGIMVEKMPGFVPPRIWAEDPDKRVAQRETLAGDLLFKEGLAKCKMSATRNFVQSMFGSSGGDVELKVQPSKSVRGAAAPLAAGGGGGTKTQTTLSMFFRDTACMDDERLARQVTATRRAVRKEKEDAAAAPVTEAPKKKKKQVGGK